MPMRRTTLILIISLVVVIAAGVGLYVTGYISLPTSNTNTTNTANIPLVNTSTNTATVTNTSLPSEVKGDTTLTGKLTIGGVALTISSMQYTTSHADVTASATSRLVMVYTDPIPVASVASVVDGMVAGMKVTYKGGEAEVRRYKVASDVVKNDRGYFLFEVPKTAGALTLVYGSDLNVQRVDVPAPK